MIKAIGYNITKEEQELIIKPMAKVLSNDLIEIIDIRSVSPSTHKDDILFVYGERALNLLGDPNNKFKLIFPDLPKLDRRFGDDSLRQEALEKLLNLKKILTSGEESTELTKEEKFTEEEFPRVPLEDILSQLKQNLKVKGVSEWIGHTKNGKVIRITEEPEIRNTVDINITFAELFALKIAMEALQVKELEIVYKSSVSQNTNK